MYDLRDLEFLSALARYKHFAKAAAACGVSQPAFSMRIRGLEERLGFSIVRRGNRYQGMTPEGEAILRHARKILDEMRALEQDVLAAKGQVTGTLVFGVIPTAAAFAARLAILLHQAYPGVLARIETASSLEIQQRLEDGTLDAGLTYSDAVVGDLAQAIPLYEERYFLLTPDHLVAAGRQQITWAEAAEMPLTLLEPRMQNRRIIDLVFEEIGAVAQVIAEASAMSICVSMVREGLAATVVPEILLDSLGPLEGTEALALTEPVLAKSISFVSAARGPGLATVEALRDIVDAL
ncbi:transcriptional regulator, LysR family [Candidatus Rhodobacter oscarellae]|uniref:Transcriptional regulator, LysR family n=1 Tax=Candidatus Rhodobacter oscarellae TaxID=1675527 RepID=A0A0J9EFN6_9RHOB|nr:LysR family transcriptional regulator [Candidatus Rhodobacter lobularis]KMW60494.1 transcriptional regulator, LysR family [Candidatus Rhodobacter lobularis]